MASLQIWFCINKQEAFSFICTAWSHQQVCSFHERRVPFFYLKFKKKIWMLTLIQNVLHHIHMIMIKISTHSCILVSGLAAISSPHADGWPCSTAAMIGPARCKRQSAFIHIPQPNIDCNHEHSWVYESFTNLIIKAWMKSDYKDSYLHSRSIMSSMNVTKVEVELKWQINVLSYLWH